MTSKGHKGWLVPALGTLVVWGLWAFLPKLAMLTMDVYSVLFYEAIGSLLVILPILLGLKFKIQGSKEAVIITAVAATLTATTLVAYFYALKNGPVAVIVTLTAMYPVVAILLARVFLKEKINPVQCLAIGMAVLAILLLASG